MDFKEYSAAFHAQNDYILHYGIKGMQWGIRRYQNKDGSLTPEGKTRYSEDLLKNTKTNNLDKWGKSDKTNTLYLTGMSGSGKSTLADHLSKKHNAEVINLDSYLSAMSKESAKQKV